MKILHISTFDNIGGAAKAAYRLHEGLCKELLESSMLVMFKNNDRQDIVGPIKGSMRYEINRIRRLIEDKVVKIMASPQGMFYAEILPDRRWKTINSLGCDIINLHWVTGGFLSIRTIGKIKSQMVWTLHDSWAFTGGCHIPGLCKGYETGCGNCPLINKRNKNDLSQVVFRRKQKEWNFNKITIVSPSNWLANCARKSALFRNNRIEVIPNGIDPELFKQIDKKIAKELFRIPQDKLTILFGAINYWVDPNKGLHFLIEAIDLMPEDFKKKINLVLVGKENLPIGIESPNFSCMTAGCLQDQVSMVALYSAAEVTVVPSICENLSNMVVESLLCGTPAIAFNIGGMPDLIKHKFNGYLVEPYKTRELSEGIQWILNDIDRNKILSKNARIFAMDKFTLNNQVNSYIQLYKEILND